MSFLQPMLLFGLPLVALPIVIHLINRWRHRTLPWGAMMFLLDAKRLNRGMARLRFWLIMLTRMLAIAAMILALARPLTALWRGFALGGQAESIIVLLDRSASMEQLDPQSRRSKRTAALEQMADVVKAYGSGSRLVLIESVEHSPREIESAEELVSGLDTSATATSADLPAMMQAALDYVVVNETGRTDIWICSDLRKGDWNPDDGRWASIRDDFQKLDGVKFYVLSYAENAEDNVAVRVLNVRQRDREYGRELVFDVLLRREGEATIEETLPCEFVINGTRSVVNIELTGQTYLLQGHSIAVDEDAPGGWGRVAIPADENLQDNSFCFVFTESPVHHTTIVYENPQVVDPLRIAATAPLDPSITYTTDVLSADQAGRIELSKSSLVLWQAALPEGGLAVQLADFVASGRPVIFFPPDGDDQNSMFDCRWGEWKIAADDQPARLSTWRGDSDLYSHAQSGEPLGLGELKIYAHREIHGERGIALAKLDGGDPLLLRAAADGRPAYFCSTLPLAEKSNLAQDGVALYVSIQRALARGAATQSKGWLVDAGSRLAKQVTDWQPADQSTRERLLSTRWTLPGVFQRGEQWMALNRPAGEDLAPVLELEQVDELMSGLDYRHVDRAIDESGDLTSEAWRTVLAVMGLALIGEAWLCLPEKRVASPV